MGDLASKIGQALGIRWLTGKIRDAAEGELGPRPQAAYLYLLGKKMWTALVLACVSAVLFALDQLVAAGVVITISGVLMEAGLLDKAWRSEVPEGFRESRLYVWLFVHADSTATLFATLWLLLQQVPVCTWIATNGRGLTCDTAQMGTIALTAVFAQLGLVRASWRAAPPLIRIEGGKVLLFREDRDPPDPPRAA